MHGWCKQPSKPAKHLGILVLLLFLSFVSALVSPFGKPFLFCQFPGLQLSKVQALQTFMTAATYYDSARSALIATAQKKGYPGHKNLEAFERDTTDLTQYIQWGNAIQSDMIDKCSQPSTVVTSVSQLVPYLSGLVTDPVDTIQFRFIAGAFVSGCGTCPNGWKSQGCSRDPSRCNNPWTNCVKIVNTCTATTACMEAKNKPCYEAVNSSFTNLPSASPPQTEGTPVRINVTQIQHNGTCVHHDSDAHLGSCSSSSSKHLFAVMNETNQLVFPDMSAPISANSAAYCFFGNQDGRLDIGTGSQCDSGWQFQHVASHGGNPKGTWPVQIVANGLCWTASSASVGLSRCDTGSAQQIFVLVPV